VGTHGQLAKLFAPAIEEWLTADHKPACSQLDQACKDRIKVTLGAGMQDMELQSEDVRCRLQFFRCGLGTSGIGRIDERGNHGSCSSSSRFGPSSTSNMLTPVMLPPGRFRLATSPT
jgi:hypothetical protein